MSSDESTAREMYDRSTDQFLALERRVLRLEKNLESATKRKIEENEDLLVAPSMKAFNRCREILHEFNKKNAASSDPFTWGDRGRFRRIECVTSMHSWLFTDQASLLGLDPMHCSRFEVVDTGSELVTVDSHYKGGLGVAAFWIPERKYKETPAAGWATPSHKKRDPRQMYLDPRTGEAWTAHPKKMRPGELCEEFFLFAGNVDNS